MNDLATEKAVARKTAFGRRKAAFGKGLDQDANGWLLAYVALHRQVNVVAGYMPIRTEISPLATMTILHEQGKRICVPVIQGPDVPLAFHEWKPDCEMIEGPFGAAIPKKTVVLEPELLITPLVAWDGEGYRLGYGGGYYDRSFEQLRAKRQTIGVGFAYEAQRLPAVPREATDQRLDAVVTEQQIHFFDGSGR